MTVHRTAHDVYGAFDSFGITMAGVIARGHADRAAERQDRETVALARAIVARRRAVASRNAEAAAREDRAQDHRRRLMLQAAAAPAARD